MEREKLSPIDDMQHEWSGLIRNTESDLVDYNSLLTLEAAMHSDGRCKAVPQASIRPRYNGA